MFSCSKRHRYKIFTEDRVSHEKILKNEFTTKFYVYIITLTSRYHTLYYVKRLEQKSFNLRKILEFNLLKERPHGRTFVRRCSRTKVRGKIASCTTVWTLLRWI